MKVCAIGLSIVALSSALSLQAMRGRGRAVSAPATHMDQQGRKKEEKEEYAFKCATSLASNSTDDNDFVGLDDGGFPGEQERDLVPHAKHIKLRPSTAKFNEAIERSKEGEVHPGLDDGEFLRAQERLFRDRLHPSVVKFGQERERLSKGESLCTISSPVANKIQELSYSQDGSLKVQPDEYLKNFSMSPGSHPSSSASSQDESAITGLDSLALADKSLPIRNITTDTSFHITSDSFDDCGKMILQISMHQLHEGARFANVHTGLAEIYNDIPANPAGIEALIHDTKALTYATDSYQFLMRNTMFSSAIPICNEISTQKYPGAQSLTGDMQRILTQILLYPHLVATSAIRMPAENIGMAFMGTDPQTNGRVLTYNKDINAIDNKVPVRGIALAYAYVLQLFASK